MEENLSLLFVNMDNQRNLSYGFRYCLHVGTHKHTTPHTHTDNNVVQTICLLWVANFHSGHVHAWPHSFLCLWHLLRMEICKLVSLDVDFLPQWRQDDTCWHYVVIVLHCQKCILSLFCISKSTAETALDVDPVQCQIEGQLLCREKISIARQCDIRLTANHHHYELLYWYVMHYYIFK